MSVLARIRCHCCSAICCCYSAAAGDLTVVIGVFVVAEKKVPATHKVVLLRHGTQMHSRYLLR
jgi:hypothetical protein